ncbi:LysR substrate-binding domain-containing protein [Halomonas sp. ATCH28]|uniref:LysR substrate-binding domain-containing protein n=1 Tax=Halomonas gemina TaxID=2945105 RepID=A0ABT0T3Q2_9GAMM|nr:LysR substrate-binding domain-containing protein [Halomonas gemina]MCL7941545.1 LysR substrate-binding domain-containing protein [Halomonas gemina]
MLTPLPLNKLPPLSSLRGFEAAARLQNLRAAAEELHLTHPAIANQIQRLEESLGVKLFERQGRHVVLTEAGHRFYPHVREAISTLINGAEAARQLHHADPLRMQVYVTTSIRWLAPRLVHFYESHPDVELQVMTYSVGWEFDEANADIAIIYRDKPLPSHLHWVPLFPSQIFPVCSPDMVKALAPSLPLEELMNYPLIEVYTESWSWESWFSALSPSLPTYESDFPRGKIVVDTLAAALEMAERGEGVALVNGPFADDALAEGRLINPANQVNESQGEWGIVCHKDIAFNRRTSSLISWLASQTS